MNLIVNLETVPVRAVQWKMSGFPGTSNSPDVVFFIFSSEINEKILPGGYPASLSRVDTPPCKCGEDHIASSSQHGGRGLISAPVGVPWRCPLRQFISE